MRIAHIVCAYPPYYGGMGNVVFETAERLVRRGHEVMVYTPQYLEAEEVGTVDEPSVASHAPELQERIERVKRLTPTLRYGNAARLPTLARELDNFDIVHLHYPFFGTANLVRRWKLRHPDRPLVITYHMDTRGPGWKGLIFKCYAKYWMPKILGVADLLIASSFDYLRASDARTLFAAEPKRWLELPFGVNLERFQPREPSTALLQRHALSTEYPTILFVGGMDEAHYFKGIRVLLQALAILQREGVKAQAVFVGDGTLRAQYEREAGAMGVAQAVRFVGRVSDAELSDYYNLADLFVLPSTTKGEAFGMVLLEAMASGIPVIASDLPGVRELAHASGAVVPPGDSLHLAQAIADYMAKAIDNPETIAFSRDRARQTAEQLYDWEFIIPKLEAAYRSLASSR